MVGGWYCICGAGAGAGWAYCACWVGADAAAGAAALPGVSVATYAFVCASVSGVWAIGYHV